MAKSLVRGLIDRAIGGQPGADLAADLAAIEGSFGVLADQDSFAHAPDQRMNYLDKLDRRHSSLMKQLLGAMQLT